MTNEEMLRCLQGIEQEIDVQKLVYSEIAFWPLLRVMLYTENVGRNNGINIRKISKRKQVSFLFSAIFERFYDKKHHLSLRQADCYFLTASNSRYLIEDKGYFDIFVSPLVEWTKKSCHIDELVPMADYRLPRSEKTCFIQYSVYFRYLLSVLFDGWPKKNKHEWSITWKEIKNKLSHMGYTTDLDTRTLNRWLIQLSLLSKWFERRLGKINPQCVIVMCYYTTPCAALIHAANNLGIKTIDLQHGVQGKHHVAYGTYYNIPKVGWSLLPKFFWNWTGKDAEHINAWGQNKYQGINGGIIWHQYLKNTPVLHKNWFNQLSAINSKSKPCILVTFQPLKDNKWFIDSLQTIIKSEKGHSYFWLLRLHPGMIEQTTQYQQFFDSSNCNVDIASTAPLPLLLEDTVLHITRYSSVVIEAAIYGISSFVEQNRNYYQDFESSNQIIYFSDDLEEQFLDYSINVNKSQKESLVNSAEVWEKLIEN